MGRIRGICLSQRRGTKKKETDRALLIENFGLEKDAHGGNWHRQVSLLSWEKTEEFKAKGAKINYGDFGENIVAEGFDFKTLPVGTRLRIGGAVLEITQIGKECHSHCEIYHQMGDCIMPREGVFAKVIKGGEIAVGDCIIQEENKERPFQAAVITLSDRASKGEREDTSGPAAIEQLKAAGYQVEEYLLLPDGEEELKKELIRLSDSRQMDLILTTGGTGFSQRDCTPEATLAVATRNAPGIAEAVRSYSMTITKRAMLSRGVSVIRGRTLIVNLPGSTKAVLESLALILEQLEHGIRLLRGEAGDCAGGNL